MATSKHCNPAPGVMIFTFQYTLDLSFVIITILSVCLNYDQKQRRFKKKTHHLFRFLSPNYLPLGRISLPTKIGKDWTGIC